MKKQTKKQTKTVNNELSGDMKRLQTVISRACQHFKAPENITVSEWANKYRRLSSENSAEAGRWKTSRTPYLKDIMDSFSDDRINRIVVVASSQVGKTEMLLNLLGYVVDQDPGPIMYTLPTKDDGEDFSKRRLSAMMRDTVPVRNKMAKAKGRDSNNTIYKKSFPGGMLTITGTNAPRELASVPSRYVFGDELDRWAKSAGTEGDPWSLLEARTSTFYNSKMVAVSTPTIRGDSKIDDLFKLGTQEYWSVQCPDCGEYSYIEFDNIRFKHHEIQNGRDIQYIVDEVGWVCPKCGCYHDEQTVKHQPMRWVAESPEAIKNGARSFWINGFSSPWLQWSHIVTRFLEARKDPEKLQTVYNTLFGQLWENRGDLEDEETIANRAEDYGAELPDGVLCLTCGVDTQDNRLEYEVVGYGFFEENWGIEKGVIDGNPADFETWYKLDGVIDRVYRYKNGQGIKIGLTFVDSGGHYTQEVYEQCAMRIGKRVFAIKGANRTDTPYTSPPKKAKYNTAAHHSGTTWFYLIGVDAGKEHIMSGLKVKEPGARMSHFPLDRTKGYDSLYFSGLLSEHMVRNQKGEWRWEKIPGHERNEALDCRNYANAAFKVLHPNMDRLNYLRLHPEEATKKPVPVKKKQQRRRRDLGEDDW